VTPQCVYDVGLNDMILDVGKLRLVMSRGLGERFLLFLLTNAYPIADTISNSQ
jgi:hypothetical protein